MKEFEKQILNNTGILEKFEDGTATISLEAVEEYLASVKPKKFTLADATLILLYAQKDKPIFGRIMLTKEMFLLLNEILEKDDVQDPKFVPYRFGPYSFVLGNVLSNLEFSGFINRTGRKNSRAEQFTLTDKGKNTATILWNKLSENVRMVLPKKRKGWDQLGVNGILKLVYGKYEEYTKNSCIKGRYKNITSGRGTG